MVLNVSGKCWDRTRNLLNTMLVRYPQAGSSPAIHKVQRSNSFRLHDFVIAQPKSWKARRSSCEMPDTVIRLQPKMKWSGTSSRKSPIPKSMKICSDAHELLTRLLADVRILRGTPHGWERDKQHQLVSLLRYFKQFMSYSSFIADKNLL
jgi:hypothetical protein